MFLFEGDQLRHETVIRGVKYVTVSHYSGERDIFEVIGNLITDSFRSSQIHKLTKGSSVDLDMDMEDK